MESENKIILPPTSIVTFNELIECGVKQKQVENWLNREKLFPIENYPIKFQKYLRADLLPLLDLIGTKGRPKKDK